MMRYLKIFLLHFEHIFEHRLRSFVWFLIPFVNTLPLILFWRGMTQNTQLIAEGWNVLHMTSYYLLVIIAGPLLIFHVEEDVAELDIKKGDLVRYLLRPFPYYVIKFFEEIPYRIIQGSYGFLIFLFILIFFPRYVSVTNSFVTGILAFMIIILALFISYFFKMCLGLCAFWFVDNRGFYQLFEIVQVLFAGYIMPIALLPQTVKTIAFALPFPYMLYYPIVAVQGKLALWEMFQVMGTQFLWLAIFIALYQILWLKGIKQFTAVGR